MSDGIDLEVGEPDPEETPAARRRRERREREGSSKGTGRSRSSSSSDDSALITRLDTAFVKLADQMMARNDEELAEALREERHAMSQGLVSLTATLTPLRLPLIVLMALLEPALAFWRVGRILLYRFLGWRERRVAAMQEQQAAWQAEQEAAGTVVQ